MTKKKARKKALGKLRKPRGAKKAAKRKIARKRALITGRKRTSKPRKVKFRGKPIQPRTKYVDQLIRNTHTKPREHLHAPRDITQPTVSHDSANGSDEVDLTEELDRPQDHWPDDTAETDHTADLGDLAEPAEGDNGPRPEDDERQRGRNELLEAAFGPDGRHGLY